FTRTRLRPAALSGPACRPACGGPAGPGLAGRHTGCDLYRHRRPARLVGPARGAAAWHSGGDRLPHPLRRIHARLPDAVARAGATLVPTRELAADLRGSGFRRVRLLARAVDTQLFDPAKRSEAVRAGFGAAPGAPLLIHVGRLAAEKNLPLALRAFRMLQARRPDACMVWVGDGPLRERLQRENPDCIFTGVQRGADLARLVASADLFIFPSLSETFGNVTLESMASGVPLV